LFIFQQDGAPAHAACSAQNRLPVNYPDFITKYQWPPNSPNVNPIAELKEALQDIWGYLPQGQIDKTVKDFSNLVTEGLCWSLELAVDTSNIDNNNEILTSDY